MRRWALLAMGVGAYALALIVLAPATLLDIALERSSAGRLRLAEAQGTLWSGSGRLEIRDARQRIGVGKRLTWRMAPTSLLRGQLTLEVQTDSSAPHFPVTISLSSVEIAQADMALPAAALGLIVRELAPLDLTGDLLLHVKHLKIDRQQIDADATLQWTSASSALSPISPLGGYEMRVEPAGPALRCTLRTLQGPLEVQGEGSWTHGSKPVFRATARVPLQLEQQLAPLLRLIAVERGEGRFDLELR